MALCLEQVVRRLRAESPGAAGLELFRLAPPEAARTGDLSFVPHKRLRNVLATTAASAVLVDSDLAGYCRNAVPIIVTDALVACAEASAWLAPRSRLNDAGARSVQAHEVVDRSAVVAPGVSIGRAVTIGAHTRVAPGCVIGDGVRIGSYCDIGANVAILAAAALGNRVRIGANSTIGGDAFTYARSGDQWLKLPDFGSVEIDDDVDIGNCATIDRGAIGHTTVRRGTKIDNHVHLGHGCVVGEHVAIAAHVAVAGEATIGKGCLIGGAVGVNEGVVIAERVRVTAMSMVSKSLLEPGVSYSSGWPAERSGAWWRRVARLTAKPRRTV
ncbi:MAG: UDP-3-O-(3-hydroxymyristoyl)glucosamine N-acyltransferase [Gammaproteobacteria bacterium]